MSSSKLQQAEELDPAFVALVEAHSAAVNEGRMEDAAKASAAVMEFAGAKVLSEPDPDLLKEMIAHRAEADREWDIARRIYTEDLEAATRSVNDRARFLLRTRALLHLANIESSCGDHHAAFELATSAVEAAREGDLELIVATALESFAGYALAANQPQAPSMLPTKG